MIRLVSIIALGFLAVSPGASAQDRGVLAIGLETGRHAFSFSGEADAVNMCGTVDCEVVATFTACLGVAYSSPTQGQNVWTWVEAATEEDARVGAMNGCTAAGGPACEVLNVFCLDGTAIEAALDLDSATRRLIQEWLQAGGFDPGGADGLFGPRTRRAIRQWQAAQSVPSTGYLTSPQIEALEGGDGSQLQASVTGTRVVDLKTVTANVADAETNIESSDQGVAQDLGFLAIGSESATHAFSFSGVDDAVNMCGMTDCEVVATFEACLGVAYSRPILERAANLRIVEQVPPVWRWAKAVEEGDARVAALQECQRAGGTACEVLNVYCVDVPDEAEAALVSEPAPDRLEDPTRSSASFRPDSTCSDRRETRQAPCWMEITRLPGCYVWNTSRLPGSSYVDHQVTATWDGECVDGLAEGQGTLTKTFAVYTGGNRTETGRLRGGRAIGNWVWRYPNGEFFEGPMVEGERHGRWTGEGPTTIFIRVFENGNRVR